jgi:hypothetical protein
MTRYPSQHRRIHRACLSPHHRLLRQAALLLDPQDILDKQPHNGSLNIKGNEFRLRAAFAVTRSSFGL